MKKYFNIVIINGVEYSNVIEAESYKEALQKHKEQKRKSRNKFKGRLTLNS